MNKLTFEIEITQADIDTAREKERAEQEQDGAPHFNRGCECPAAVAITRAVGRQVACTSARALFRDDAGAEWIADKHWADDAAAGRKRLGYFPDLLGLFVIDFDSNNNPKPLKATVTFERSEK